MSGARFEKVLIANRGEIAVRLIRACHRLNLRAVAVFSDADEHALHVELAGEAVRLGPAEAKASYLDMQRIIDAAKECGAGAIHPGYGFLAENAEFARRCAGAGLVFVGPSPDAIAAMGDKIRAKQLAEKAGVPCVPGYHGAGQDDETLQAEARRIGVPLLIKASAGGGGRGMRRVDNIADFASALSLARQEARAAFGNPTVLLEKYVQAPRHIEVQVLADRHGNVRHLFERDCSVQRSYQKLVEEAPAPNLDPGLRQQILDWSVKLAAAIGYDNAGTVEFVVDAAAGRAWFMEMNTRLQVEHPVTEMVTGFDLAGWQLRIAAGEAIDFAQSDVRVNGCAIEARIAAEDPADGYRPCTGRITAYAEPAGEGVRVDSGVRAGSEVPPWYDSMLAKLIVHGSSRDEAIRRLRTGLAGFHVAGIGTNAAFLHEVLALDPFREGRHLTGLLEDAWPDGWTAPAVSNAELAQGVLARHACTEQSRTAAAWGSLGAWRLGEACGRNASATYYLRQAGGDVKPFAVSGRLGRFQVSLGGEVLVDASRVHWQDDRLWYRQGNMNHALRVLVDGRRVSLHAGVQAVVVEVLQAEDVLLVREKDRAGGGDAVRAPTPGRVSEVLVSVGERVSAGQPVLVLEAMKMFQQLTAPEDGIVASLPCKAGDTVNGGDLLLSLQARDEPETKKAAST